MLGFEKGNLLKITQRRTKDDPRIYLSGEVGCFQLSLPKRKVVDFNIFVTISICKY